jgi:hypothetical protein
MLDLEECFLTELKAKMFLAMQLVDQRLREKKYTRHAIYSDWTMDQIDWVEAMGKSGPYERADFQESRDFAFMLEDLAANDGTIEKDGFFLWKFRNSMTVGRKRRKETS